MKPGRMKCNVASTGSDQHRTPPVFRLGASSLAVPLALAGCSHPPEYSIFGSFFPAWIFCAVGGLVLMAGARAAIARTAIADELAAPVLLYLSLAVFLTCMLWLLFYS